MDTPGAPAVPGRLWNGDALPVPLAVAGLGKIARDQHLPAVAGGARFRLLAVADPGPAEAPADVRRYADIAALLDAEPTVRAVAICTPPQSRYAVARQALERGLHVMLEKPPAATLGEVEALAHLAKRQGVTLFAAWHSRFSPAVEPARDWLRAHPPRRVRIDWREDVRVWHPGQTWIWRPGGLGVFDPGINALSILTRLIETPLRVVSADLRFPSNCGAPVAADLRLDGDEVEVEVGLDFLQTGPQTWDIMIHGADGATLRLSKGGSGLEIDGRPEAVAPEAEYASLYARFARLIAEGRSDVDVSPLRLTADAFLRGQRVSVGPFVE